MPDKADAGAMALAIKICGLSSAGALDVALAEGADMVGFVFFEPSPRHVGFKAAADLGRQAAGRALKVALSVDADDAWLDASVQALRPDMLQLHGKEAPARVAEIKARFGLPVMKAIAVERAGDLALIETYRGIADHVIFDARAPKEATRPGGLGQTFDWHLLENLDAALSFMLSGGLNPGNVAEALRITRAPGVDVSSGVERRPGEKDPDKISSFIRAARAAERELDLRRTIIAAMAGANAKAKV